MTEGRVSTISEEEEMQLVLKGDFDISNTHQITQTFEAEWKEKNPKKLLIDLRDVTFIDASGVNNILRCARKVKEEGQKVVVVSNRHSINRIFEILQITRILKIFPCPNLARLFLKNNH